MEKVKKFDSALRREQRAMQNTEFVEIDNKKVKYSLYSKNDEEVFSFGDNYTILWYDSKMKNYVDLVRELPKKKWSTSRVKPILVVDKLEQMVNVYKLEESAKSKVVVPIRTLGGMMAPVSQQDKKSFRKDMKKNFAIEVLRSKFKNCD